MLLPTKSYAINKHLQSYYEIRVIQSKEKDLPTNVPVVSQLLHIVVHHGCTS